MSSGADSRIALVTGAAMGIGAAIAEQLARDGLDRDASLQSACRPVDGTKAMGSYHQYRIRLRDA
jgi:NAD(P)-dependent dehydrogenase (short-subunit alcohol dehydrogenase family)